MFAGGALSFAVLALLLPLATSAPSTPPAEREISASGTAHIADADDGALSYILHPHSVESFVKTHLERRPLHVTRGDAGYYMRLFSMQCVDRLAHHSPVCPSLRTAAALHSAAQ